MCVCVWVSVLFPPIILPNLLPTHTKTTTPPQKTQTRVDRGLPDDSFILLKPGESWRVGDASRVPFLDRYRDEPRLPLSH